jgi:hypothetical protein
MVKSRGIFYHSGCQAGGRGNRPPRNSLSRCKPVFAQFATLRNSPARWREPQTKPPPRLSQGRPSKSRYALAIGCGPSSKRLIRRRCASAFGRTSSGHSISSTRLYESTGNLRCFNRKASRVTRLFRDLLEKLSQRGDYHFSGSAGGDLAEIITYYSKPSKA